MVLGVSTILAEASPFDYIIPHLGLELSLRPLSATRRTGLTLDHDLDSTYREASRMRSLRALIFVLSLIPAPALALADDRPAAEKPFGLKRRIPWNDSRVIGTPDPLPPYKVVRAFPKLNIKQPLTLTPEPGTNRLFIVNHLNFWAGPGRLLAVQDDQDASKVETLLEIDGLAIGMAFHPDYERNGYIYIGLNGPLKGRRKATQAVRYTVDRKPPHRIDPRSKLVIIDWASDGHDGGDVAFGDDGYLYVSSGDGSSGSDANITGQSLDDLLGAVLRIDVDHPTGGRNYGIPRDNPFVDRPGARPEIWAYGLRNPWRMSFDRKSGQLWVGQNGQDLWEQVYLIRKGGNYGWSLTEGSHVFNESRKAGPDPILLPTAEHPHSEARSLTGGRVYRGPSLTDLVGVYVYGDWSTGHVWGIKYEGGKKIWHRELVDTPFNITGFGTDHSGEMYVIDHVSGFYRMVPTTEADKPSQPFPTRLSQTGLFASVADHKPHPAALPFEVSAPQWADGATMERFAALPGLDKTEQKPQKNAGGAWTLPEGSVLIQTLSLDLVNESGKPAQASRDALALAPARRVDRVFLPMELRPDGRRTRARRRHGRGARGGRQVRARRPPRPELAVPGPHRVHGLPLASRRLHAGIQPTPARPRPRLWRHRRQPAPRARAHRRLPGRIAQASQGSPPPGQPLRVNGPARGQGQVLLAGQLLGLPRQRRRGQLPHGAGARHPAQGHEDHRRGPHPRHLQPQGRPPRRPRLDRAIRALLSDLATGHRANAAPGLHRG